MNEGALRTSGSPGPASTSLPTEHAGRRPGESAREAAGRRWRAAGLALALSAGLFALPPHAHGCTCAPPASPAFALERADRVFLGMVERFEVRDKKRVATFWVKTVWKGPRARRVRVLTGAGDGDCGVHFVAGLDYVVYAYNAERRQLETSTCSRTASSKEAQSDLLVLGTGVRTP